MCRQGDRDEPNLDRAYRADGMTRKVRGNTNGREFRKRWYLFRSVSWNGDASGGRPPDVSPSFERWACQFLEFHAMTVKFRRV
jgi:hypothetical protein